MNRVFILLSSNDQPYQHFKKCLALLKEQCAIKKISSIYETAPVGAHYKDNFWDAVVMLETTLSPFDFKMDVLDSIENQLGRKRTTQNGYISIPIDLDILLWGNKSFEFGSKPWRVPDPKILDQAHLAIPLAEIAPDYLYPQTGRSLRDIADSLSHEGLILRSDLKLE